MKPAPSYFDCRVLDTRGRIRGVVPRKRVEPEPAFAGQAEAPGEKLYIVRYRGEFVYVGRTDKRISARLKQGLNAWSYRYKWRDLSPVRIYVRPLPGKSKEEGEAVEAELVRIMRQKQRRWPSHQHEIHFRNTPGAAELAARLYAEIMK